MNDIVYVVTVDTYWKDYGSELHLAGVFTDKDTAEKEAGKYVWKMRSGYTCEMGSVIECRINEAADLFHSIYFHQDAALDGFPQDFEYNEEIERENRNRYLGGYIE